MDPLCVGSLDGPKVLPNANTHTHTQTHELLLLCVHYNSLEGAKGERARESGQWSVESGECKREQNRIVALALLTCRKKSMRKRERGEWLQNAKRSEVKCRKNCLLI